MRKGFLRLVPALCITALLLMLGVERGFSQEAGAKSGGASKEDRWSGTIVRTNDKVMTLTVRKERIEKIIHYTDSTRWTEGTKDGVKTIERTEVKDGDRVICLGSTDAKGEFIATRIDKRKPGKGAFKEE